MERFEICIQDKKSGEQTILKASLIDDFCVVVTEHEFKGREIAYDRDELFIGNNPPSQCFELIPNEQYMVVYVNDLWEKICRNCKHWEEHSYDDYGDCLHISGNGIICFDNGLAEIRVETKNNFGCNKFELK